MTDDFEKKVAVDGPVVNAGELGSSTFSPGQALPAGPLGLGQRWTVARKREVVLRLLRDEPVQLLSRQLGVEIFRLEQWREKAIGGIDASLTVPDNVTLALLPPYSPELNPVERVWLYLRERFLSLRVLDDTEAIIDACCQAWIDLIAEPDRMPTLCAYPWIMKVIS